MLEKEIINDKIEVVQSGNGYPVIQIRTATIIKDDGEEISRNFHRKVLNPDADLTEEDQDVAAVAATVFTSDVKNAYAALIAQQIEDATPKIAAEVVE